MTDEELGKKDAQMADDDARRQNGSPSWLRPDFSAYEVPRGEYGQTREDDEVRRDLRATGHSDEEIDDPYHIRGGKPLEGRYAPLASSEREGPGTFVETPETQSPEAASAAPAQATEPPPALSGRVSKAFANPPPPEEERIDAPVDMSTGAHDRSPLAHVLPPAPPQRDVELERAVGETQLRNQIGNVFRLMGIEPANIDQPLQMIAEKRQLEREHQQDVQTAELHDPGSRTSRMAQAVAIKRYGWSPEDAQYLTASDMPMVNQGFNAEEVAKSRAEATKARLQQSADTRAAREAQTQAYRERTQAMAGKTPAAKPPGPTTIRAVGGIDTVLGEIEKFPEGGTPAQINDWANRVQVAASQAETAGRMSKPVLEKIKTSLPGVANEYLGDIPGVHAFIQTAGERRDQLKSFLQGERESLLRAEEDAGHDVSRFRHGSASADDRAAGAQMVRQAKGGVPAGYPEPEGNEVLEFEGGDVSADQANEGKKPLRTSTPVREPGGKPVKGPRGGGPRVNVIMANGRPASLPAEQVDAARKAGAIR